MPDANQPAPTAAGGGGLRRYRAVLAYDGTAYHGWARQPGLPTVEGELVAALARVARVDRPEVTCAGRTDAGVHARGQVIHVDLPADLEPRRLRNGLNAVLPADVRCRSVAVAEPGFDARFAALWRRYHYRVCDDVPDPLTRTTVLAVRRPIDVPAMAAAARLLVGEHDFGSFCRPRPGASAVREVLACSWQRDEDGLAVLEVRADAFCHSMVRSIVGACLAVGTGQRPAHWVAELLALPSRERAAPVAPAHGLVLTQVGYPPPAAFPEQVARARRQRPPLAAGPPSASGGTSG